MACFMQRLKFILRDIPTTLLIITGFMLSYFVTINGINMMNNITNEMKKSNQRLYENESRFLVDFMIPTEYMVADEPKFIARIDTFIDGFQPKNGNLIINNYSVIVGDNMECMFSDVVCVENEDLGLKLVSGRMPIQEDIDEKNNVVLLSTEYEKHTVQRDGKTQIRLNDIYYNVIGYYKTKVLTSERRDIILFKKTFSEKTMSNFLSDLFEIGYMNVIYGGNNIDINKEYSTLTGIVKRYNYIVGEDIFKEGDTSFEKRTKFNKMFLGVLFGFTLINCIVISSLWIQKRYKELVIRKTFGYDIKQIICLLVKDLFKYSLISYVLAIIIQLFYSGIWNNNFIKIEYFIQNSIYVIGSIVLVITVTMIIPLIKIRNEIPAKKLQ